MDGATTGVGAGGALGAADGMTAAVAAADGATEGLAAAVQPTVVTRIEARSQAGRRRVGLEERAAISGFPHKVRWAERAL
jgi:predicted nicotinamide N-methyase